MKETLLDKLSRSTRKRRFEKYLKERNKEREVKDLETRKREAIEALGDPEFYKRLGEQVRERIKPVEKLRRDSWKRAEKKAMRIRVK